MSALDEPRSAGARDARSALALGVSLFLSLTAYYLLKTAREPLIQAAGGATLKSQATALQAVVLCALVPIYMAAAARFGTRRLVVGTLLVAGAGIEGVWAATALELPHAAVGAYVLTGVFGLAVVSQLWSVASARYDVRAGERLLPMVAIGSSAGGLFGALLGKLLFERGVAVGLLLHAAAGVVVLLAALASRVTVEAPRAAVDRWRIADVLGSSYVRTTAVLLVVLNLVNTTGEIILADLVGESARLAYEEARVSSPLVAEAPFIRAYIGAFYGDFFFWVNLATLGVQVVFARRIVQGAGVGGVLVVLPLLALGVYAIVAVGAGLAVVRIAKAIENTADYSLMNVARAALFLPANDVERWGGKLAVDTFFVRAGDLLSGAFVLVMTEWLHASRRDLAAVNIALVVVWLAAAMALHRAYRTRATAAEDDRRAVAAE